MKSAGNDMPIVVTRQMKFFLTKNGANFEFVYLRSKIAALSGVSFNVEFNDDLLLTWTPVGPGTVIADDGTLETLRAIIPASSSRKRFIHLKVSN